jgi:hypothetical protein
MTQVARKLFRVLLKRHKRLCRGLVVEPNTVTDEMIDRSVIFYGELIKAARAPIPPIGVGRYLDEIGAACEFARQPLLNALAISKKFGKPGLGYEGAHGGNRKRWRKQVRECIAFKDYDYETVPE